MSSHISHHDGAVDDHTHPDAPGSSKWLQGADYTDTLDLLQGTGPNEALYAESFGSGASEIHHFSKGPTAGGRAHSGGSGGPTTATYSNTAGMEFVVNYDSSVSTAPSGFKTAFETAVHYFLDHFVEPITITLNVGWGEVAGSRLPFGALGESETFIDQVGYSTLKTAMTADATAGTPEATAAGSLPDGSPISGGNFWVATAEEKALGLLPAHGTSIDGYVGFSSRVSWDFTPTGAPTSRQYDFISIAEHEISEAMGRIALLGESIAGVPNGYSTLDLFRYSAADTRSLVGGQTAYASYDSGHTNLDYFNATAGGDWGDWSSSGPTSAGNDAYDAFAAAGTQYSIHPTDTSLMNALGYQLA